MKPTSILSITGSINKNALTSKANLKVIEKLQEKYKNSTIKTIDLNDTIFAKTLLSANNFSTFYADVDSDKWINLLKETDILVISSPMINFNYSSLIKNFIDGICVANKSFSYKYSTKGGSIGLINNLKVIIISSQGAPKGWYLFGNVEKSLTGTFKFLGAKKVKSYLIDGTKVEPKNKMTEEELLNFIDNDLEKLVKSF